MHYVSVVSSTIEAVAYDEMGSTLGVRFHGGREYRYRSVPKSVFQGLFAAPSKGRYFDQHVKHAGFPYLRVA
jgi:KTSC domain-containing protein